MVSQLVPVQVSLSVPQKKKLVKGLTVRLTNASLHGPVTLHVPKLVANRIAKARANGKGMQITLSQAALKHNQMRGSGLFDVFKKIAGPIIGDLAGNLLNQGANALGGVIK